MVSLLNDAFSALVKARDRAGQRYEPLHEEIADICDDVMALMEAIQDPEFDQEMRKRTIPYSGWVTTATKNGPGPGGDYERGVAGGGRAAAEAWSDERPSVLQRVRAADPVAAAAELASADL